MKHARYETSWRLWAARCLLVQNSLTSVSTTIGRFVSPTLVSARLVGRPSHLKARSSWTTDDVLDGAGTVERSRLVPPSLYRYEVCQKYSGHQVDSRAGHQGDRESPVHRDEHSERRANDRQRAVHAPRPRYERGMVCGHQPDTGRERHAHQHASGRNEGHSQRDTRRMACTDSQADDRGQGDDAENRDADDAEEDELDGWRSRSLLMCRLTSCRCRCQAGPKTA